MAQDELVRIKAPIREEMKHFESHFRDSMKTSVPLLNVVLNHVIRRKGKQMRPMFVFLTARMLGQINSSTYTAASLVELLHNATLIHDDVVDKSYRRRGYFSIHALWKSKISVLVGDFLLSRGLLLSVRNKEYDLLEIVSHAVEQMSEGELLQVRNSRKLYISEEAYFDVVRKKTASLIASCTACGARSVGRDESVIETLRAFGEKVGIAFQIKDDLLDYERSGVIGKPAGNDIKEKKVTLPLIYALNQAREKDRKAIKRLFGRSRKNGRQVNEIIDFVRRHNGLELARDKMKQVKDEALRMLAPYSNDNPGYNSMVDLVEYTINRTQ